MDEKKQEIEGAHQAGKGDVDEEAREQRQDCKAAEPQFAFDSIGVDREVYKDDAIAPEPASKRSSVISFSGQYGDAHRKQNHETAGINSLITGHPHNNFDVDMFYLKSHGLSLTSLVTEQHQQLISSPDPPSPTQKKLPFVSIFHQKLAEYRQFRSQATQASLPPSSLAPGQLPTLLQKFSHLMQIRRMQVELEELAILARLEKEKRAQDMQNRAKTHGVTGNKEDGKEGIERALRQLKEWNREKELRANPPYRRMRVFKMSFERCGPDDGKSERLRSQKTMQTEQHASDALQQLNIQDLSRYNSEIMRQEESHGRNTKLEHGVFGLRKAYEWDVQDHLEKKLSLKQQYFGKLMARFRLQQRYRIKFNQELLEECCQMMDSEDALRSLFLKGKTSSIQPSIRQKSNTFKKSTILVNQSDNTNKLEAGPASQDHEYKNGFFVTEMKNTIQQDSESNCGSVSGSRKDSKRARTMEEPEMNGVECCRRVKSQETFETKSSKLNDDTESFNSDESYYDEDEVFDTSCLTKQEEHQRAIMDKKQKVKTKVSFERKLKLDKYHLESQARNLARIGQISESLNAPKLQDRHVSMMIEFMKKMPCFEGRFVLDNKMSRKNCLEKMKIKIFCRSQVLFNQGDAPKYAYIVLMGVVNFYDETIKNDPNKVNRSDFLLLKKIEDHYKTIEAKDSFREKDQAYFQTITKQLQQIAYNDDDDTADVQPARLNTDTNDQEFSYTCDDKAESQRARLQAQSSSSFGDVDDEIVDTSLDYLRKMQFQKCGSAQAGELIGDIDGGDQSHLKKEFTAICKTDCILLELEQDVFDVLNKQRLKRQREYRISQFVSTFPKSKQLYTIYSIGQKVPPIMKQVTYTKGQAVVREGPTKNVLGVTKDPVANGNEKKLHLIIEGTVTLCKKVQYFDQNDILQSRNEQIMELHANQVLGEDLLLYNRDCQYTAIVSSQTASFFQIDHSHFKQSFSKLMSALKPEFDSRIAFIQGRCDMIRFFNEYKCLDLGARRSARQANQWFLHKQYLFQDGRSGIIDKKFWPMYNRLRTGDKRANSTDADASENGRKYLQESASKLTKPVDYFKNCKKSEPNQITHITTQSSMDVYGLRSTGFSSSSKGQQKKIKNNMVIQQISKLRRSCGGMFECPDGQNYSANEVIRKQATLFGPHDGKSASQGSVLTDDYLQNLNPSVSCLSQPLLPKALPLANTAQKRYKDARGHSKDEQIQGVVEECDEVDGTEASQEGLEDGKRKEQRRKIFLLQALNHGLVNPISSLSPSGRRDENKKMNMVKLDPMYSVLAESKEISSSSSQNLDSQTQMLRSTIKEYSDDLNLFKPENMPKFKINNNALSSKQIADDSSKKSETEVFEPTTFSELEVNKQLGLQPSVIVKVGGEVKQTNLISKSVKRSPLLVKEKNLKANLAPNQGKESEKLKAKYPPPVNPAGVISAEVPGPPNLDYSASYAHPADGKWQRQMYSLSGKMPNYAANDKAQGQMTDYESNRKLISTADGANKEEVVLQTQDVKREGLLTLYSEQKDPKVQAQLPKTASGSLRDSNSQQQINRSPRLQTTESSQRLSTIHEKDRTVQPSPRKPPHFLYNNTKEDQQSLRAGNVSRTHTSQADFTFNGYGKSTIQQANTSQQAFSSSTYTNRKSQIGNQALILKNIRIAPKTLTGFGRSYRDQKRHSIGSSLPTNFRGSEIASTALVTNESPGQQSPLESVKVLKIKDKKQLLYSSQDKTKASLMHNMLINRSGSDIGTKMMLMKGVERQQRQKRFENVLVEQFERARKSHQEIPKEKDLIDNPYVPSGANQGPPASRGSIGEKVHRLSKQTFNYKAFFSDASPLQPEAKPSHVYEKDFLNVSNSSVFEHLPQNEQNNLDVLMNGSKVRLNQRLGSRKNQMVGLKQHVSTDIQSPGLSIQCKTVKRDRSKSNEKKRRLSFKKTLNHHQKFKAQPLPFHLSSQPAEQESQTSFIVKTEMQEMPENTDRQTQDLEPIRNKSPPLTNKRDRHHGEMQNFKRSYLRSLLGVESSSASMGKMLKQLPQGIGGGGYDFGRADHYKLDEDKSKKSFRDSKRDFFFSNSRESTRNVAPKMAVKLHLISTGLKGDKIVQVEHRRKDELNKGHLQRQQQQKQTKDIVLNMVTQHSQSTQQRQGTLMIGGQTPMSSVIQDAPEGHLESFIDGNLNSSNTASERRAATHQQSRQEDVHPYRSIDIKDKSQR